MRRKRSQRLADFGIRATVLEQRASLQREEIDSHLAELLDQGKRSSWKLMAAGLLVRKILSAGRVIRLLKSPVGGLALLRLAMALFRVVMRRTGAARR